MKGCSKMKIRGSAKSRSMDLSSDPLTFLEPKKPNSIDSETHLKPQETTKTTAIKNFKNTNKPTKNQASKNQDSSLTWLQEVQENNNVEMFSCNNIKLKRNSSVSSASALHSAVRKAFSLRRSSSVSERYCRIHNQPVALSSPPHDNDFDDDGFVDQTRSLKKRNSKRRILRACKKLLGL